MLCPLLHSNCLVLVKSKITEKLLTVPKSLKQSKTKQNILYIGGIVDGGDILGLTNVMAKRLILVSAAVSFSIGQLKLVTAR